MLVLPVAEAVIYGVAVKKRRGHESIRLIIQHASITRTKKYL
jgi:hypothetical protein